jgi:hypothetical protein
MFAKKCVLPQLQRCSGKKLLIKNFKVSGTRVQILTQLHKCHYHKNQKFIVLKSIEVTATETLNLKRYHHKQDHEIDERDQYKKEHPKKTQAY